MASASQQPKVLDGVLSTLDIVIRDLNVVKDTCGFSPAQNAIESVNALLTTIRDSMDNEQDYIELGLSCADVCQVLDRGLKGRESDELNQSVLVAIGKLTIIVAEIQGKVAEQVKLDVTTRDFYSKSDKDTFATWRQELNRILLIFSTELLINDQITHSDTRHNGPADKGGTDNQHQSETGIPLGELAPPPPKICYGRDALTEEIVGLAENLESVALISAGGIGKTSIALKVLHHDRIKERFGENRRFIRCDQFPASRAHLLSRLSHVIGAGIENPEDMTPLRPFLSSSKMILFLDNAESILDPAGPDVQEIYSVVEELAQFDNICLGITSRIAIVPSRCKRPTIPTLSMGSACDIFYDIYNNGGRSNIINDLVRQLDFHALSIALLARVASHSMWDHDRLAEEWETQRAKVHQTSPNENLAAAIELSLASQTFLQLAPPSFSPPPSSPTFHTLAALPIFRQFVPASMLQIPAPSARELLEVVAFFPQGVDENNLEWLFPTVSDIKNIFDQFCILSLTYRSNGFVTMLAPIRDHFGPRNPKSSPLLCATKDNYFSRLSVGISPNSPRFGESQWVVSEDANIEHLLDIFTSIDPHSGDIWDVCCHFMEHLYWHKPRQTVLTPKIQALPDDHPSKPKCLSELSRLFGRAGNHTEQKRLLTDSLRLERLSGSGSRIARTLKRLSEVNRILGHHEEGIQQVKEALGIYERLGNTIGQAMCSNDLASSLFDDGQLDAAKDAALHTIDLVLEKGQEHIVCKSHRVLGNVYQSKGEREKAIHHFKTALEIASPFNWHDILFWTHYSLAEVFLDENELYDANVHIEQAKSHATSDAYYAARATHIQARVWYRQGRLEDASSETLHALGAYEKLGAAKSAGVCRDLLQAIERAMKSQSIPVDSE